MATRIRTRNELIEWLEEHVPIPSIARALQEGTVENLGAFKQIDPYYGSGWIVKITSKFAKIWFIAIKIRLLKDYFAHELKEVPWVYWEGDKSTNKLYQGDKPEEYKLLRSKELHNGR